MFAALKKLYEAGEIDFTFSMPVSSKSFGEKYIRTLADEYGIKNKCKFIDYKNEAREVVGAIEKTDLLYLKQGFSKNNSNIGGLAIAAKTFEYLATGYPILVEAHEGEQGEIIKKYSENSFYVTEDSMEKMEETIKTIYQNLISGKLLKQTNEKLYQDFRYSKLTGEVAEVFNEVTAGQRGKDA